MLAWTVLYKNDHLCIFTNSLDKRLPVFGHLGTNNVRTLDSNDLSEYWTSSGFGHLLYLEETKWHPKTNCFLLLQPAF